MNNNQKAKLYNEARQTLQEWTDKQGENRCWYYPDIFRELARIFNISYKEPNLPPRDQFESGCKRYQDEEYKTNQ